jgi:hypothetical protein
LKAPARLLALAGALASAIACAASSLTPSNASEAEIKAAFLCKFGNYIEWPPATAPADAGTFGIAIAGSEAEADVLQRVAAGTRVNGHPIRVHRLAAGEAPQDERIIYVTQAQAARAPELAAAATERGMLLVTDAGGTGQPGGMVTFVIEDNKVRFDVDVAEAATARLKVSGRLLSVARRVTGATP